MDKEKFIQGFLSIRNRILIFSVLATLVPSMGMGLLLNGMMHSTITEKIEQKLLDTSSIIDREISFWVKERNYDLRVFSSSYIITDNFTRYTQEILTNPSHNIQEQIYYKNIVTYLSSVQNQFEYYTRLYVLDTGGKIVVSSETLEKDARVRVPADAMEQIAHHGYFKGEVYFRGKNNTPYLLIGTPLFSEINETNLGMLAVEVQLQDLVALLSTSMFNISKESSVSASLVRLKDGQRFITLAKGADNTPVSMPQGVMQLFDTPSVIQEFEDQDNNHMVGIVVPLEELNWGLIIAEEYDTVYSQLIRSRNRNILIALCFALIIGLAAYHFSSRIITPLTGLTNGALEVAAGDLNVRLPVYVNDEIGLTTKVFNKMVVELHQSHRKLQELATTDALTGMANRKRIMEILQSLFEHHKRYITPFSILMIDIDFFKNINDTYGHMAGDAVLKQVSAIFIRSLRNVDYSGRYGGEEFLVVLPETAADEACKSAERIRQAIESHIFLYEKQALKVTVSIGVTATHDEDKSEDDLIRRADDALYKAKAKGRNQVVPAGGDKVADSEKVVSMSRSVK